MEDNKNSSLRSKDKAIIKIIIAAIILVAGYLAGNFFSEKTSVLVEKNAKLAMRVQDLENADRNQGEIRKELKKMESDKQYVLSKFPSNFTFEKTLEYLLKLWDDEFQYGITNVSYSENGDFYTFVNGEGQQDAGLGKIASTNVTVTYSTNYNTLKKLIDEINLNLKTKASLSNIQINQGEDIDVLTGQATFVVYYGANETEYEEPEFDASVGKKKIFGAN